MRLKKKKAPSLFLYATASSVNKGKTLEQDDKMTKKNKQTEQQLQLSTPNSAGSYIQIFLA